MDRVAGIDTSLTSSGVAIITRRVSGDCIATTTTITSRGKRDDGLPERANRMTGLAGDIDRAAGPAVLVVIENPAHGAKGGSPMDRHHLWWLVVARLITRGVPVALCAPATRAKFATGTGRADKAAVSAAVTRLWPGLELANSDEADALALAHAGAVRLGWEVPTLQRHHDALAGIRWPANLTGALGAAGAGRIAAGWPTTQHAAARGGGCGIGGRDPDEDRLEWHDTRTPRCRAQRLVQLHHVPRWPAARADLATRMARPEALRVRARPRRRGRRARAPLPALPRRQRLPDVRAQFTVPVGAGMSWRPVTEPDPGGREQPWTTTAVSALPAGWVTLHRNPDGSTTTVPCPAILVQELRGQTRVVFAGDDAGRLVPACELGDYLETRWRKP